MTRGTRAAAAATATEDVHAASASGAPPASASASAGRRRVAVPEQQPQQEVLQSPIHHTPSVVTLNKNVNWLGNPGFWVFYLGIIGTLWLVLAGLLDDGGLAWTYTHLLHGVITYYLFHVTKGTPFVDDATDHGRYQTLTFWEQVDNQRYGTVNRKLLTLVPVVLFVLATHGTDFRKQPLGLNLGVVLVLLIAKLPALHKVRIFGINRN